MSKLNVEKLKRNTIGKWVSESCPLCNEKKWDIQSEIFSIPQYQSNNQFPQKIFPVVPIACTNCGNTIFVSALYAGVIDSNGKIVE